MSGKVVIAHAVGEEELAEMLARPLQGAGYEVAHRGTVMIGESFNEEASKALAAGGPIVLCATVKSLGTGWAHQLIRAAQSYGDRRRIFAVRMEQQAYMEQLATDHAIAEYWQDPERAILSLLDSLRRHYPLAAPPSPASVPIEAAPLDFVDQLTGFSDFDPEALQWFRAELRETSRRDLPDSLSALDFLEAAGWMRNRQLTRAGLLLVGYTPASLLPSATTRCVVYRGASRTADRDPLELRGTVPSQIARAWEHTSANVRAFERVVEDSPQAERIYQFPMRTVREVIANALVHRDYQDSQRLVHVRLFTDRIEVLSPGKWLSRNLPEDGSSISIEELISESVKRNLSLATAVAWIRFVEGEGSGLPTAVEECRNVSAPIPTVTFADGFTRVTVYPRPDWNDEPIGPSPLQRARPRPLHQLPPPLPDFVGRQEELAELSDLLEQAGSSPLLAIHGMAGAGKTALLLQFAQDLEPLYPDAQIFFNLQGASQQPVTPSEAMGHVIRTFHPESRYPEGEPEIAALYRSVLRDKCALLVLDDAAGPEQIQALVPPAGNALLLTSRRRFHIPGLASLDLDVLCPEEARTLLRRIVPRISDADADEIARLCGYLPLALRLAGANLMERRSLKPEDYISRLRDALQGAELESLRSLNASLNLSYDLLSTGLQKAWRTLGVFHGTFDAAAAEAVWQQPSPATSEALDELVSASFLEWEGEDRYRLHGMLRALAEQTMEPAEREKARKLHSSHYLGVLWTTSRLYQQGGEAVWESLHLFDRNWENIRAGQAWAADRAQDEPAALPLCRDYPIAGAYLLDLRQPPAERMRWLTAALDAARQLQDSSAEALHLSNLGNAHFDQGDLPGATQLYEQALVITKRIRDRRAESQALGSLGNAYFHLGDLDRVVELYQSGLTMAREMGNRREEGVFLNNLGAVYAHMGNEQQAVEFLERRLVIARELGDLRAEETALGNLGAVYSNRGDFGRAVELQERRLALARKLGDRRGEGSALANLGNTVAAQGDFPRAVSFCRKSLEILRDLGDRQGETEVGWSLGWFQAAQGDLESALPLLQARVDFEREIGSPRVEELSAQVEDLRQADEESSPPEQC